MRKPLILLAFIAVVGLGFVMPTLNKPTTGVGFIGAYLQESKLSPGQVYVHDTMPDFPAGKAGLQPGDVIVRIGDYQVTSLKGAVAYIKKQKIGFWIEFEIRRSGKNFIKNVKVADREQYLALFKSWKESSTLPDTTVHLNGAAHKTNMHTLLKKKNVVFFYASWCPSCKKSLPILEAIHRSKKANVIGISSESQTTLIKYSKQYAVQFPLVLLTMTAKTPAEYLGEKIPRFFLLDKNGNILDRGIGNRTLARIAKQLP